MNTHSTDTAYSPDLSAELTLHGERFAVAAFGGETVVICSPRPVAPGHGIVRMLVDGEATVYQIDLWLGINPGRRDQPFRLVDLAAATRI